jgi:hypothetical protein
MITGRSATRMNTSIERVFRRLPNGLYKEFYLHYLQFINEDGSLQSSKLDKQIPGRLYKKSDTQISAYGEVEYLFPGDAKPTRLVALGYDIEDTRYGRF